MKSAAVVPELPSTTVMSSTDTDGTASSSVIVTTACPSPSSLRPSAERSVSVTLKVSLNSSMSSELIGTVNVLTTSADAEGQRPGLGHVVVGRRGAVRGRVVDVHGLRRRDRARHCDERRAGCLVDGHVGDREQRNGDEVGEGRAVARLVGAVGELVVDEGRELARARRGVDDAKRGHDRRDEERVVVDVDCPVQARVAAGAGDDELVVAERARDLGLERSGRGLRVVAVDGQRADREAGLDDAGVVDDVREDRPVAAQPAVVVERRPARRRGVQRAVLDGEYAAGRVVVEAGEGRRARRVGDRSSGSVVDDVRGVVDEVRVQEAQSPATR